MSNFEEGKVRDIIRNIASKENFSKNMLITFFRNTGKIEGYMAEIVRIKVVDEAKEKSIDLIAKISMKGGKVREVVPIAEAYDNEIHAYMKVFPVLKTFQIEAKTINLFDAIPKFYAASSAMNEEYIIMEDLSKCGYEMLEMRQLLDDEHTEFIMKKYGELHALSFALRKLHPLKFEKLQNGRKKAWTILFTEKKIGEQFSKIWEFIKASMSERGFTDRHINDYSEKCLAILDRMIKHDHEDFCCFLHGDCWSNNLMFKYKNGHKRIDEMKMLDWQYCNVGPPVQDLSYSLYSAGTEKIWTNLGKFLRIYHESLSNFLTQFHLDAQSVYPFEELKRQWRQYYHFGAILAGPIWKFRSFEDDQGVDPLNYTADDDSIYLDALAGAECNRDYLFASIRHLCEHLNKIDEGGIKDFIFSYAQVLRNLAITLRENLSKHEKHVLLIEIKHIIS